MKNLNFDCIIIGGGPAGLTAAIYLQSFSRRTLIIDSRESRVQMAPQIRNLVGYSQRISGKNLLIRFRRQARRFNSHFLQAIATVKRVKSGFLVQTGNASFRSPYVI